MELGNTCVTLRKLGISPEVAVDTQCFSLCALAFCEYLNENENAPLYNKEYSLDIIPHPSSVMVRLSMMVKDTLVQTVFYMPHTHKGSVKMVVSAGGKDFSEEVVMHRYEDVLVAFCRVLSNMSLLSMKVGDNIVSEIQEKTLLHGAEFSTYKVYSVPDVVA